MTQSTKSTKAEQFKLDATTPFYAVVGMTDVAVEFARTAVADAQERLSQVTQADLNESIDALASRGKKLVDRVRNQQATQDVKKTAETAKRSAKATGTTVKKTAAAAAKASGDAAAKIGD